MNGEMTGSMWYGCSPLLLCDSGVTMKPIRQLDGQPGVAPWSVSATPNGLVLFKFEIVGIVADLKLGIKCYPNGAVTVAIISDGQS
jgi:hypothetical protein